MKENTKSASISIDGGLLKRARAVADQNRRSLSAQLEIWIEEALPPLDAPLEKRYGRPTGGWRRKPAGTGESPAEPPVTEHPNDEK